MAEVDNIIRNRSSISWAPKLAITMKSVVIDKDTGANKPDRRESMHDRRILDIQLEIKVRPIEVGKDENGKEWERQQGSRFIREKKPRKGFIPHWKDEPTDTFFDKDESSCLIDDTPANRLAIQNLSARMKAFLGAFYEILDPSRIENTVKTLIESSAFLLPGAGETGRKKK